jgi:hypothetical protein
MAVGQSSTGGAAVPPSYGTVKPVKPKRKRKVKSSGNNSSSK